MSDSGKWEYEIQRWQIQNLITARMNLWGDEGWGSGGVHAPSHRIFKPRYGDTCFQKTKGD